MTTAARCAGLVTFVFLSVLPSAAEALMCSVHYASGGFSSDRVWSWTAIDFDPEMYSGHEYVDCSTIQGEATSIDYGADAWIEASGNSWGFSGWSHSWGAEAYGEVWIELGGFGQYYTKGIAWESFCVHFYCSGDTKGAALPERPRRCVVAASYRISASAQTLV